MLRKEGKFMLGTINEVAKELYKADEKNFSDRFVECDFAVAEKEDFDLENDDLDFIFENATGYYGIKKIDPGFDNVNYDHVDLFADYYGGGCGTYRLIGDWNDTDLIIDTIKEMIIVVLSYQEGYITEDTILICELK